MKREAVHIYEDGHASGDTELWKRVSLLNVVEIVSGQVDPKQSPYNEMILVAPDHIEPCTGRIISKETARTQSAISGKYYAKKGCVLYSKIRPYLCKAAIADEDVLCSADMYPIHCKDEILPQYLLYILLSKHFTDFTASMSGRTGIPKINREELAEYHFDLPTIENQLKISKILNTWDTAITQTERLIAAKQKLKKGLMQQLLTGKRRLESFKCDWKIRKLSEVAIITMGSSPPSAAYNDMQEGLPLIQGNADIVNRVSAPRLWTSTITKTCNINDILVSVRAPVGEVFISHHHACIGRGMCAIKSKKGTSLPYLFQSLLCMESQWIKLSQGSTFTAINSNDLKDLKIQMPDDYAEQEKIADILSAMDGELSLLKRVILKIKEQKRGLMQKLLTGQVRVKI